MRPVLPKRLKAPSTIIAAAAACIILTLGLIRWPIADDAIAPRLQQALDRSTGYTVESIGEATFSALPWPSIQITELALRKPSSPHERVDASLLKARINVASWLSGKPKFVELSLFDPRIQLASSERLAETEALSTALLNFLSRDRRPELRSLRVERGTIRLDGEPWMTGFRLLVATGARSDLRLAAEGRYRGAPVVIEADVGPGDDRRPLSWTVSSERSSAQFDGTLLGARSLDAEGNLSVSIADGAAMAGRLKLAPAHALLLNGLRLRGRSRIGLPFIQIRDAIVERGGDRLEGSIELSVDARSPSLSATLDTERFDLTPILQPITGGLVTGDNHWSADAFKTGWLHGSALDVRLSAARLLAGPMSVENAAFSAQLGGGRLDLILSDGRTRSGQVKARLSLMGSASETLELKAQGQASQIDASQMLGALGTGRVRGTASGQFFVEASGRSPLQWSQSIKGRGQFAIRDGDIAGIELDHAAVRNDRAASAPLIDVRTRFSLLNLQMRIADGSAQLFDSFIATPIARTPVEGAIDLQRRSIDITTRPNPAGAAPLKLQGPWSSPALIPDSTGRLNRT